MFERNDIMLLVIPMIVSPIFIFVWLHTAGYGVTVVSAFLPMNSREVAVYCAEDDIEVDLVQVVLKRRDHEKYKQKDYLSGRIDGEAKVRLNGLVIHDRTFNFINRDSTGVDDRDRVWIDTMIAEKYVHKNDIISIEIESRNCSFDVHVNLCMSRKYMLAHKKKWWRAQHIILRDIK